MSIEYVSLILFAVATCITPGPNNMMVLASGVNFGFRRSLPHLVGINLGFPVMVVAVGLGVAGLFTRFPELHAVLRVVGAAYLVYLAYRIATSGQASSAAPARPLTVLQAALFQWVNPKAWIMAVGGVVTYSVASGSYFGQVLVIALVFMVFGTPCTGAWLWFGSALRGLLEQPARLRAFNLAMAALLLASLVPTIQEIVASAIG